MDKPNLIITNDLAQALLNYLRTRPYEEVYRLIPELMTMPPVPVITPPQDDGRPPAVLPEPVKEAIERNNGKIKEKAKV